ncbi:MAG: response regulator transcription factor [Bacteroidetes bacterium]|nr:response regulator transcription factor [Bacteroidota bacterium]
MNKIKIVLVDDHNIVRNGLKILLMYLPDIEVVGEANNDTELFQLLENIKPDILLMDITLPEMSGISITRKITHDYPEIKVIMLTANINNETVYEAMKAGALGYLPKDILQEELVIAIKTVYEGNEYIAKSIINSVMKTYMVRTMLGKTEKLKNGQVLTNREIQIIKLLAEGFRYKDIADQLNISIRTVESHKNNILEKLELKSIVDLVRYAIKNKITSI